MQTLVEGKINTLGADIEISKTKILQDFSGNQYQLIECTPTGYFITHLNSGITVEYSTSSHSPYKDQNNNLYYGGPMSYYVKSGSSYTHTILGTVLTDMKAAALTCDKTAKELESNANLNVLDYISGKTNSLTQTRSATGTNYTVKDPNWFKNRSSDFGYVDGGNCGYIAANLLLKYWYYHASITFSDLSLSTINSTALTNKLISIGGSGGSWASPIASTINTFCSQKNIPQCANWHVGIDGAVNEIQTYHRPVILFGHLQNAGNHAAVAYAVNDYENPNFYTFTCHYGWDGWPEVHICGPHSIFGTSTQYNLPDEYQY